jgi:hypothetical protein
MAGAGCGAHCAVQQPSTANGVGQWVGLVGWWEQYTVTYMYMYVPPRGLILREAAAVWW